MVYRVEVAGKIFEGSDFRLLLKRAVEAKRAELRVRAQGVPLGILTRPPGAPKPVSNLK